MLDLSAFERIAYKHLVSPVMASLAVDVWPVLLTELDKQQVPLEKKLDPKAMATLFRMRKKKASITTWLECFESTARVTLEDGTPRMLRREMTHSIHNAAKRAALKLEKIWARE